MPRHKGGANTHHNIGGLCDKCHDKAHKSEKFTEKLKTLKKGTKKRYDSASILNTIMPYLYKEIQAKHGEDDVYKIYGYETKKLRDKLLLSKTHYNDSYTLSLLFADKNNIVINNNIKPYTIKQFRRHNRQKLYAIKERVYKLYGKVVAKNRNKRTEQKDDSLKEYKENLAKIHNKKEIKQIVSALVVTKSRRSYNSKHKFEAGDAVLYNNKRYIVKANVNKGNYLYLYNYPLKNGKEQNIPARDLSFLARTGLAYL